MQPSPPTAPEQAPSRLGLPRAIHSMTAHATAPAAAEKCVAAKALEARPSDLSALPALKPNQPTHNRAAPIIVYVRLCGGIGSLPKPNRRPTSNAQTSPVTPDLIWTTVPPAKS